MQLEKKLKNTKNPFIKELLTVCLEKQTNISFSVDISNKKHFLTLINEIGPHICLLKTHIDTLEEYDITVIEEIKKLANVHRFLILEDRKFADIGSTTYLQYSKGIYKISNWANCVTAHGLVGEGLLKGIYQANHESLMKNSQAVFLLAQMSCDTPFFTDNYARKIAKMADIASKKYPNLIAGFIAQNPNFLTKKQLSKYLIVTPGVNFELKDDNLGQKYHSPKKLISIGSDILIIGRGIYSSKFPIKKAKLYQKTAWDAYLNNSR